MQVGWKGRSHNRSPKWNNRHDTGSRMRRDDKQMSASELPWPLPGPKRPPPTRRGLILGKFQPLDAAADCPRLPVGTVDGTSVQIGARLQNRIFEQVVEDGPAAVRCGGRGQRHGAIQERARRWPCPWHAP